MRKDKAFTLIELVIVVVVIGVLSTLAVAGYQSSIEGSKSKVCATNEQMLKTALDIYSMEHDTMPASLSAIPDSYKERAYAMVMRGANGWWTRLAARVVEIDGAGRAYAQSFMRDVLLKGNLKVMTCPSDDTPPTASGGTSYALNDAIVGLTAAQYRDAADDIVLIVDSNNATFPASDDAPMLYRHGKTIFNSEGASNMITAKGIVYPAKKTEVPQLAAIKKINFRFHSKLDNSD